MSDSAIIRRSGDSTDYCFRNFDGGSWQKPVVAKFVPRLLSIEQKEFLAEVTQDLFETPNKDPNFPRNVITGDESWVYGYDPETKVQSSQRNSPESPCPKKALPSRRNIKAMMTSFLSRRFCPPRALSSRPDNN